jgi:hypothetical protein
MIEGRREVKVAVLKLQLAGLDLGDIQNVVDDREQMLAGSADLTQSLDLRGGGIGAQQVGKAEDGVKRRANLVDMLARKLLFARLAASAASFAAASSAVRDSTCFSRCLR